MKSTIDYAGSLPEVLAASDVEESRRVLGQWTLATVSAWNQQHLQVFEYGGRNFRMLAQRSQADDQSVVTFAEFGTYLVPRFSVKSQITRALTAPDASLVVQVGSIAGENNMNYSRQERRQIASGQMGPLIGRMATVMDSIGQPGEITLVGTSQGAVAALAYGADSSSPSSAVVAIEPPTVLRRSPLELVRDFATQQNDLVSVVAANFDDSVQSDLVAHLKSESHLGLRDVPNTIRRLAHPDNLAVARGMARSVDATDNIVRIVEDKPESVVVHAWGDADRVSPAEDNRRIAANLAGNPRYQSHEVSGLSHSALTDYYPLYAALAREAHRLRGSAARR